MKYKLFVLLSIVYRILLDLLYIEQISPFFDYRGFVDNSTNQTWLTSWIFFGIITIMMYPMSRKNADYATSCVALLFYFMRLVPLSSLLYYIPQRSAFVISNLLYWCILLFLLSRPLSLTKIIPNKVERHSIKWLHILAAYCVVLVVTVSGLYAHFRFQISIADVYDLREESRRFDMPLLLRYLHPTVSAIMPILIICYYKLKSKWMVILLVMVGIMNFSINGSKSTLFLILLSFVLAVFNIRDVKRIIVPGFLILCGIALLEFKLWETNIISILVIRRVLFIPGLIDTFVFDYISQHQPLYFNSDLAANFDFIIGDEYFGSDEDRANNGLFSDAFKNIGYIGCLFMPIVISLFIKVFSQISKGLDRAIVTFAALIIVEKLGSTSFTTCLLTHGLFLLLVALYLIPLVPAEFSQIRTPNNKKKHEGLISYRKLHQQQSPS